MLLLISHCIQLVELVEQRSEEESRVIHHAIPHHLTCQLRAFQLVHGACCGRGTGVCCPMGCGRRRVALVAGDERIEEELDEWKERVREESEVNGFILLP